MKREFSGSCPKELQSPESNEDCYEFSTDGFRLALCDGASESYNSRLWAEVLAKRFVADPKLTHEWLAEAQIEYAKSHDFSAMSWSKQAAFERGSFSTLIGVDFDPTSQQLSVTGIGDSIVFLTDSGRWVESWPISNPEQFKEHPTLLSTLPIHNQLGSFEATTEGYVRSYDLTGMKRPVLICATDALGEWALRQVLMDPFALDRLKNLTSEQDFCALVNEERQHKRMRLDDSTLIVLSFVSEENADALPVS